MNTVLKMRRHAERVFFVTSQRGAEMALRASVKAWEDRCFLCRSARHIRRGVDALFPSESGGPTRGCFLYCTARHIRRGADAPCRGGEPALEDESYSCYCSSGKCGCY